MLQINLVLDPVEVVVEPVETTTEKANEGDGFDWLSHRNQSKVLPEPVKVVVEPVLAELVEASKRPQEKPTMMVASTGSATETVEATC